MRPQIPLSHRHRDSRATAVRHGARVGGSEELDLRVVYQGYLRNG